MKLSNKYKSSEYILLFSILVLALLLGTYFSFYAFLWRDIDSNIRGFSKDIGMNYMHYQEGISSKTNRIKEGMNTSSNPCKSGEYYCNSGYNPNNPSTPGCQCQANICGIAGACML